MAATREQKYNGKNTDTSVVMEKVQDSKFTATWDFEFDEGIVKAYCKRCPRGVNNEGASVNNMTQTDKQHQQRCTAKTAVVGKRRIDEDNFGPVPLQERNLPQDMLRAVRRRLGLFLVTSRTPFRQVDNVHLQAMFNLLGVDLRKEKYYRTTQLEELHEEVKEVTMKEVGKLLKDGFVICSDGWRYKYAGNGAPLVNFILLKPDGGVIFIKVVDVSGKRKDATAIKDLHLEVLEGLRKEVDAAGAWWKSLNMVVDLMEPIGNAIHRLEADMPYLSQVLPTWRALVSHALTWEAKLPAGHPLAVGVVAAFKRRAQMHYDPVHAAAYVVDPAHFKASREGTHARPPFANVTTPQLEDTIDTVARLSNASTAAVRKELTALKLGSWPDDMVRDLESILELTCTTEDGKTVTADISVRRGFWDFTARQYFPLFSEAATRLLSMHVTTAAAERNWSAWGLTYEAGRAQLGIEKAEKMIYINANIPKSATDDPFELVARGITA